MKARTLSFVFALFVLLTLNAGCSTPQFGNSAQYDKEDWHFLASPGQVAHMRQDKIRLKESELSLKKLESLPVKGDAVMGYEGIVTNYNCSRRYTFELSGPEKKSYMLGPKESTTDKLIPGVYVVRTIYNGYQQGNTSTFRVGPQLSYYQGVQYHWFVYNE